MTNVDFPKPSEAEIRAALRRCAPELADELLNDLGEGWAFWAVRAGDYVLRFPQRERVISELDLNRKLLPSLAEHISLQLPVPKIYCDTGPNDAPFTGHRVIPGVSLITATAFLAASGRDQVTSPQPSPAFGRELGTFLRELHSFPTDRAVALGVPVLDGSAFRTQRAGFYEEIVRGIFPLISCEARAYTEARFEAYLNDAANFVFEPRLVHGDLDRQNVIIDTQTGQLTGVIDFGDGVAVSKPAVDLWLPLLDFEKLGIADQLPDFLEAYGDSHLDVERAHIEAEFIQFTWPFHDIQFGLWTENADLVQEGIVALYERVPRDLRC